MSTQMPGKGVSCAGCLAYLLVGISLPFAAWGLIVLLSAGALPAQAEVRVGNQIVGVALGPSPDWSTPVPTATPTPTPRPTPTATVPPTVTATVTPIVTPMAQRDLLGELRLSLLAFGAMLAGAIVAGAALLRRLLL